MRTKSSLRKETLNKLAGSTLDEQDAALMQVSEVAALDCSRLNLPAAAAGFRLPYFSIDGKATKFFRVRYMEDTRKGFAKLTTQKPLRYGQPNNTVNELYLAPFLDWRAVADDAECPLIITEGELKAACATKAGYPTVGLGGVWCFQSKKHGTPLLEGFSHFQWKDRVVYVCFDSDAVTNPDIVAAEARLARRLTELGAQVWIARLPSSDEATKVGLDDYLMLHGADAFQRYVLEGAFEFSGSEVLHGLNQRCLYVRDPGFIWDRDMRQRLAPGAFREHAFANVHYWEQRVTKQGSSMVRLPAARAWIEWEHRSEARGIIYSPGADEVTSEGLLNTWTGWGVGEPIKGSVKPWTDLMNHLFGEDKEARDWFEAWCAYPIQNPGAKLATAALLWGVVHGSGKTLVGHTLMRLYGSKNSAEIHDSDLEDPRNEWAMDKQFVLGDDIVAKGDRALMRRIMTLITQKTVRLNPKYVPSYSIPDTINYYYTSNDPDAFYMDDGDRRFFIHEVLAGKYAAYKEFVAWRDSAAGIAALWHYLLEKDIAFFDPQAPAPDTRGKREMLELGKSDLGSWVRELRENGDNVLSRAGIKSDLVTAPELHMLYDPTGAKKTTVNALARELKRAGFRPPATGSKLRLEDGSMRMAYVVRNWHKWAGATWSEACRYYNETHPNLSKKEKY